MKADEKRNKRIVLLRERRVRPTFRELANVFRLDPKTVFDIYERDKDKYTVGGGVDNS